MGKGPQVKFPAFTDGEYNVLLAHVQANGEFSNLVVHYLVLAFNPLIVSIGEKYRTLWTEDWPELLRMVREVFIQHLYKYQVGGITYFRYYIYIAVLYAVRDRINKERRAVGLETWHDELEVELPETNDAVWTRGTSQEDSAYAIQVDEVVTWLLHSGGFSQEEQGVFILHIQGFTYREIRRAIRVPLVVPPQRTVEQVRSRLSTKFRPQTVVEEQDVELDSI